MKIIKELGENRYEVELEAKDLAVTNLYARETEIIVMHDYVRFKESMSLTNPNGSLGPSIHSQVTIPISSMIKVVMDRLKNAPEIRPEQLENGRYSRLNEVIIDSNWTYFKPAGEEDFMKIKTEIYYKHIRPGLCQE